MSSMWKNIIFSHRLYTLQNYLFTELFILTREDFHSGIYRYKNVIILACACCSIKLFLSVGHFCCACSFPIGTLIGQSTLERLMHD